jgi:hypothetical protein
MKLERARELYSDYSEGTLSPAMKLAFEQHLEADGAARVDYEDFTRIYSVLNMEAEQIVEVPTGFRAKVLERAEAELRGNTRRSPWDQMRDMLRAGPRRGLVGGLAATLGVAVVALALVQQNALRVRSAGMGVSIIAPSKSPSVPMTTIRGVALKNGDDGYLYHMFRIHLPEGAPPSTINAYLVTDINQITNPDERQNATPALKQPLNLQNDEEMQIPVAVKSGADTTSVLAMLVGWKSLDPTASSGSQVVFTPLESSESPAAPPDSGEAQSFYGALEAIAARYHVTVVADADPAPTRAVSFSPMTMDEQAALHAVADQLGYDVRALDDHTYQVYARN